MKIKVIMPDSAMDRKTLDEREIMLSKALSPGVAISVDCIKKGPDELNCYTDEAFAASEMVKEAIKAEADGYDAIVTYVFCGTGIDAIRENVRIPVINPGDISLSVANMLCNRFIVLTGESVNIPRMYRKLMTNIIAEKKMTSVRALDIPVATDDVCALRQHPDITKKCLKDVCAEAIKNEQVDGVVLGCLSMAGYGSDIEAELPIKVIDPAFIAVAYAEMCARINLTHIPTSYPPFKK